MQLQATLDDIETSSLCLQLPPPGRACRSVRCSTTRGGTTKARTAGCSYGSRSRAPSVGRRVTSWPTAAIPVENLYCSWKLTRVSVVQWAARRRPGTSFEPGGCTAFRSDSNSNLLIHPARGRYRFARPDGTKLPTVTHSRYYEPHNDYVTLKAPGLPADASEWVWVSSADNTSALGGADGAGGGHAAAVSTSSGFYKHIFSRAQSGLGMVHLSRRPDRHSAATPPLPSVGESIVMRNSGERASAE